MTVITHARNATLTELVGILREQQRQQQNAIVSANAIVSDSGNLRVYGIGPDLAAGEPAPLVPTELMDGNIADKLGIPVKYLRRLRTEHVDLYDATVNGWLHGDPHLGTLAEGQHATRGIDDRKFLIRAFLDPDLSVGVGRSMMSDSYRFIDNLPVLEACVQGMKAVPDVDVMVDSCDLSERRMTVKFVAPQIAALAPALLEGYRNPVAGGQRHWGFDAARWEGMGYPQGKEPVVFAGFILSNSETGNGAFTLAPRLIVQICRNGLTIHMDALKQVHLGSRMDEGVIEYSEETIERNLALVQSQTKDAITTFLSQGYLEAKIAEITEKGTKEIEDPKKTVEYVTSQLRVTEAQADGILDHFIRGGQMTAGGVMQAVTSYAQTVDDPDTSFNLESQAMMALELAAK